MKITKIKASVHRFSITPPLLQKPLKDRKVVFCEIETDEGMLGWGMTGHFLPFAITAVLENDILAIVKGMDPRDTEAIHDRIWWKLNPRCLSGVISHALSALDIALWDIQGKKTGQSIARLMGGHSDWAESYITFGFPEYDRDQLVQSAKNWAAEGHKALKMVVAVDPGGWREDAKRVHLVRDAIGDDIDLMLDANYMFSPDQARQLCRAVEDCNLTWFEEPLYQNDARALADLRRLTSIPISAGQMEGHRWRLRELVEQQAVDILQPNCCYVGGYTEARKAAHLAQAYNLRIANGGGWPIFNMHTMAGLMNGWRTEFHVEMWEVGKLLFKGTPDPVDNRVQIPDAAGLGFEPDRDVLRDSTITQ